MSDTLIDGWTDLTPLAQQVEDLKREINNLIDQRDCVTTIHESHLASSHIQTSILAEKHNEMLRSRNQWRECAEALAKELISSRIDTAWDWESPAMKQYNQLMKYHEHDA